MKNVLHASIWVVLNGSHKIWTWRKWWNVLLIDNNSNFFPFKDRKQWKKLRWWILFLHHFSPFIACTLWSFIGCYCETLLALLSSFCIVLTTKGLWIESYWQLSIKFHNDWGWNVLEWKIASHILKNAVIMFLIWGVMLSSLNIHNGRVLIQKNQIICLIYSIAHQRP